MKEHRASEGPEEFLTKKFGRKKTGIGDLELRDGFKECLYTKGTELAEWQS